MCLDREDLREMLAFVVRNPTCIDAAVADGRLEWRSYPQIERIGWLHVVMAVKQHRRRALRFQPARHHHGMAGGRYQPRVEAEAGEHSDQNLRRFPDAHIVRADARMAHIVDQPLDETVALR